MSGPKLNMTHLHYVQHLPIVPGHQAEPCIEQVTHAMSNAHDPWQVTNRDQNMLTHLQYLQALPMVDRHQAEPGNAVLNGGDRLVLVKSQEGP